ncbi:glycosyltransferase [Micrococcus terreus]|uniref:glycosyltransferase n=1 Tax=Micrococcus terreus TaxID=574650 RepID=UPI0023F82582|nr:glycosyltransferase [Micrococcus terreus]
MTLRMGHVLPAPIVRHGEEYAIEDRALSGLIAAAEVWDGSIVVVAPEGETSAAVSVDSTLVSASQLPFEIVMTPLTVEAVEDLNLDVVTALHSPKMDFVRHLRTPVVLTSEQTMSIRHGINRSHLRGISLMRASLGLIRMEKRLRGLLRHALSAQFNGPASMKSYGGLVNEPLVFQDHRVLSRDISAARSVSPWDGSRPLRLGFSGRLISIKGPEFAVELAKRAAEAGLPVELYVFGAGALENRLRAEAGDNVYFEGFKNFRTEWLPAVQEGIDVMVMPHVQGDPSCTYFESLGSGAPILGFDNETLTPLVEEHDIGWTVKKRDVDALLTELRRIIGDPEMLADTRERGLNLVADNSFEVTTQRRMDHIQKAVFSA